MTILDNYNSFGGRHWETGSIHNALDFQGVRAPHTGKAYSEEFMLGISGGIALGYFTFHYKGYEPQLALLTRNTFNPMQSILERLGIQQDLLRTDNAEKGLANLNGVLEEGKAALVWVDSFSMPYEAIEQDDNYWTMWPIVVFGHDGNQAYIADRSKAAFRVSADALESARGRTKKNKFQIMSLEAPKEDKLLSATSAAIWQCIQLFSEAPPKGSKNNFGLAGFQHWAKMMVNMRNKHSWDRFFPPGSGMFAALVGSGPFPGLYDGINAWGDGGAERGRYAVFLEEASVLLSKTGLNEAATLFRESQTAWAKLGEIALPDEISPLGNARRLLSKRSQLFIGKGEAALNELRGINEGLQEMLIEARSSFPLDADGTAEHRARMSRAILKIHDIEAKAIESMKSALTR